MTTDALPAPPGPLERVLGLHLAHLHATVEPGVTSQLPLRPDALESGRSTALREAVEAGYRPAIARYYGAGRRECDEWLSCIIENAPGRGFVDSGPGSAHRYQIVEEQAADVLLAATHVLDLPVLTDRTREYLHVRLGSVKHEVKAGRPAPPVPGRGRVPDVAGAPCQLCALVRSALLDRGAPMARRKSEWCEREWRGRVATARAEAFLERIGRPGPPTATVLMDAQIIAEMSAVEEHTGQLAHLVELATTTSLRLRCVPTRHSLLVSRVLLTLDGGTLVAELSPKHVAYDTGSPDDLDDRVRAAFSAEATLTLRRRAAAGPLRQPWLW
ncbi:hypothetical protein ACIOGZ_28570 [Kitasatospora sp. NPDC088160]|uniref:hypothetical protein n=1 Tax=Kitasatospora sp. NPDC088160 TaxID=3364072 RepID=UPI003824CB87